MEIPPLLFTFGIKWLALTNYYYKLSNYGSPLQISSWGVGVGEKQRHTPLKTFSASLPEVIPRWLSPIIRVKSFHMSG